MKRLRRSLARHRLDGFLVVSRENIFYLNGFSGEDSWLLISAEREILITDFRFQEQAAANLPPECEVSLRARKSLSAKTAELCRKISLKKIGFEESYLSYHEFRRLQKALRSRELRPVGELVEAIRMIKEPEEIDLLRRSARMTTRVLSMVMKGLTPAMTESELAGRVNIGLLRGGGRLAFPPIVAAGARSSQPHAIASSHHLEDENILLIDLGAESDAYNSDMTRTFVLGNFPRKFKTIYRAVLGAQKKAIRSIRPGVPASLLDRAARGYLEERGYGPYFGHSLGHGVGLEVHERPVISSRSRDIVKEGMVFTIEPGVYIPGWGGIRIEDTILVTENGCEILTEYPKDLESMVVKKNLR